MFYEKKKGFEVNSRVKLMYYKIRSSVMLPRKSTEEMKAPEQYFMS